MKVILLQDVAKIGKRSEIVNVPDGYALNQLIPKRMAEAATASNQKKIEKMQASVAAGQAADEAEFEKTTKTLEGVVIKVPANVNDQGHCFKAVGEADIVNAALEQGINIAPTMLNIESPIKEVGEHKVGLVHGDKKETLSIEVVKG